jgi:hypothetical protein
MVELKLTIADEQKNLLAILGSQGKLIPNNNLALEYKWLTTPNEQIQTTSIKSVP